MRKLMTTKVNRNQASHLKKQNTLEKLYKITIESWQLTGKKVLLVFGRRGDIKNPY